MILLKKGSSIKPNTNTNRKVSDEKAQERELWFKTVVKVINWKSEPKSGETRVITEKISPKEWTNYCKQSFTINASTLKSKTQKKLDEIEKMIRKHGGFA